MKQYSMIHVPVMSFFSKRLYQDVCFNWKGVCFGYLFLLLLVCWLPFAFKVHKGFADFVDNDCPAIVTQIPVLTIKDGKASIDEPMPYYVTDPESGEKLFAIDTTGRLKTLEDAQATVLVTEKQVIYRKGEYETQAFDLRDVEEFTLTQEKINGWLATAKKYVAVVLYPFAVLGSYIGRMLQALAYAGAGFAFAALWKRQRTYAQLLRLSVVAITPCIIVKTILGVADINLPAAGLWFFVAAMGFLLFGVWAAAGVFPGDGDA